jgi:hypothetical protein
MTLTNWTDMYPEAVPPRVLFHNCYFRDGAPLSVQGEMPNSKDPACGDFPLCTAIRISAEHAEALGIEPGARSTRPLRCLRP